MASGSVVVMQLAFSFLIHQHVFAVSQLVVGTFDEIPRCCLPICDTLFPLNLTFKVVIELHKKLCL